MIHVLTILLFSLVVKADLSISRPSASSWWIARSVNTLAWGGSTPTEFSVFLYNPNVNLLTSRLALTSITQTYLYSLDVNPGDITPGVGYQIQLTDPLNSTNIYATSESFDIRVVGSEYPPQVGSSASASSSASGSGSETPTNSATGTAVTTKISGASRDGLLRIMALLVVGLASWIIS